MFGERRAIVEDEPGTTRDRVEADVEWMDVRFRLIDTGGYETDAENVYAPLIIERIEDRDDGRGGGPVLRGRTRWADRK